MHSFLFNRLLSHNLNIKCQPRVAIHLVSQTGYCHETCRLEIKAHEDSSLFTKAITKENLRQCSPGVSLSRQRNSVVFAIATHHGVVGL